MRCGKRGRTSAVRAVVAVDSLAGVPVVSVSLEVSLGDLEVLAGDDLVEGVGAAAEELAGVAVAV